MFETLKSLFKRDHVDAGQYDIQAGKLAAELTELEHTLAENPLNSNAQKALMLRYNQALQIFAKSTTHRQDIDAVFVKIDELRNIIRRTI
ncbi:hypothetical protein [Scandinavium lactucae]|jgi:hypothetical protein|uniref:Uncharacterized protein n=1 Tax=Scandinavium lactucae TaxID=3095028 RepID=A0ABU4QKB7_9ENTR|nr:MULTISPECIES: hypothetical protein [unclassified Scandinavium]MDX6039220.1 hypothetical protein [Scandinavium sp. V105_6]MDX6050291.1 hypothetical protein [Scandinavium sp. V105_1]